MEFHHSGVLRRNINIFSGCDVLTVIFYLARSSETNTARHLRVTTRWANMSLQSIALTTQDSSENPTLGTTIPQVRQQWYRHLLVHRTGFNNRDSKY